METKNNFSKNKSQSLIKPKTLGFTVFFVLCAIIYYVLLQQYQIAQKAKNDEMYKTLETIHQNIDQSLKNNYTTALTLALTINDKSIPENFDEIGKQLLASNNSIDAVQLVPNGIISYIYPLKGNEAALGLNVLAAKKHRIEAIQSIKNRKMYFAGPLELKQGGLGIVGRMPVYKNNKFWGFSAVIIRLNTLLHNSGINNIDSSKYHFQLSKINPTTQKEIFFLPIDKKLSKNSSVSNIIPDGDWKLSLTDKKPYEFYPSLFTLGIFGLLLASLIGYVTTHFFKKPVELQNLVDQQNRELLNSEIKFKSVFDQAAVGITYVDTNSGQLLEANKKYCDLLGYTEPEIKQKNIQSIVHPDDLEASLSNMEKLRKGTIREYSTERRHITKSNDIIWIRLTISPLWEINTTPTNHIAIIEDVTQRKLAEEVIFNSQQK